MKAFIAFSISSLLFFCFVSCKKDTSKTPDPADLPIIGNHWKKLNTPYFGKFCDMQFLNADTGYILGVHASEITTYNILIKTFDGGNTWQTIPYSHQFLLDTTNGIAQQLSIYPFFPNTLFTGNHNLIRSTDGGIKWQVVDTTNKAGVSIMHFLDAKNGICVGGGFVSKTRDSGFNWSRVFYPQASINFNLLQFTTRQTGYFAGGTYFDNNNIGIMGKTSDGGNTWQLINHPFMNIVAMHFLNDNVGYISYFAYNNLYKTTNGGISWNTVNDKSTNAFGNPENIYFINEKEGFIGSQYGIFHTVDNCKTWVREYGVGVIKFKAANNKAIYAVDQEQALFKYNF